MKLLQISFCLLIRYLSFFLCVSISLSFHLSVYLSDYLSIYLSVSRQLSIHPSINLSIHPSIYQTIYLAFCLPPGIIFSSSFDFFTVIFFLLLPSTLDCPFGLPTCCVSLLKSNTVEHTNANLQHYCLLPLSWLWQAMRMHFHTS